MLINSSDILFIQKQINILTIMQLGYLHPCNLTSNAVIILKVHQLKKCFKNS